MAQLRHAETSALLAEGHPRDLVIVADAIGFDRVVFDDVGPDFDPAAVRDAIARDVEVFDESPGPRSAALRAHHDDLAGPVAEAVAGLLEADQGTRPVEVAPAALPTLPAPPNTASVEA